MESPGEQTDPPRKSNYANPNEPCRFEEVKADYAQRLRRGAPRRIPEKPCRYLGVTGVSCLTRVGVRGGEFVVASPFLFPCVEQFESAAVKEGVPLSEPIFRPAENPDTHQGSDATATDFFPGEEDDAKQVYTDYVAPGDEDYRV